MNRDASKAQVITKHRDVAIIRAEVTSPIVAQIADAVLIDIELLGDVLSFISDEVFGSKDRMDQVFEGNVATPFEADLFKLYQLYLGEGYDDETARDMVRSSRDFIENKISGNCDVADNTYGIFNFLAPTSANAVAGCGDYNSGEYKMAEKYLLGNACIRAAGGIPSPESALAAPLAVPIVEGLGSLLAYIGAGVASIFIADELTSDDNTNSSNGSEQSNNAVATGGTGTPTPPDPDDEDPVDTIYNKTVAGDKTSGPTVERRLVGNEKTAFKDFNSLKPQNVKNYPNNITVGYLKDGRTVIIRDSIDKRGINTKTIEIQKGKQRLKFRYYADEKLL